MKSILNTSQVKVGDSASLTRIVTDVDIKNMAEFSGDYNLVHFDDAFAQSIRFKGRIAHGIFCTSMISAILGNTLPGNGTIILSETINFLRPAYVGDTITAIVEVTSREETRNKGILSFYCKNQDGQRLITGTIEALW